MDGTISCTSAPPPLAGPVVNSRCPTVACESQSGANSVTFPGTARRGKQRGIGQPMPLPIPSMTPHASRTLSRALSSPTRISLRAGLDSANKRERLGVARDDQALTGADQIHVVNAAGATTAQGLTPQYLVMPLKLWPQRTM